MGDTTFLTGDEACDNILFWLDAHAVTLSQGVQAQQLHRRWAEARRGPEELTVILHRLFADGWISLTPGAEPAHLRFTAEGFRRLIAPETRAERDSSDGSSRPRMTSVKPEVRRHLSEARLRHDILGVYRELQIQPEGRLIGMTLSRYWQEIGHRASDLRTGLDVLTRDALVIPRLAGLDRHWTLTEAGYAWIIAPATPECLWRLAPMLGTLRTGGPNGEEVARMVGRTLLQLGSSSVPYYGSLKLGWSDSSRLDENALLLGLDLLYKQGHASFDDSADDLKITLTPSGIELSREKTSPFAKLQAVVSRVLG